MISAGQIRARRAEIRMTQQELADKIGVHVNTIIRIESDKEGPENARGITIMKIAKALGIDETGKPLENDHD